MTKPELIAERNEIINLIDKLDEKAYEEYLDNKHPIHEEIKSLKEKRYHKKIVTYIYIFLIHFPLPIAYWPKS